MIWNNYCKRCFLHYAGPLRAHCLLEQMRAKVGVFFPQNAVSQDTHRDSKGTTPVGWDDLTNTHDWISSPSATRLLSVSWKCLCFIKMIWVFKEHLVSSERVNYKSVWIVGEQIYQGLGAELLRGKGLNSWKFYLVLSALLTLSCLIPALQHWS